MDRADRPASGPAGLCLPAGRGVWGRALRRVGLSDPLPAHAHAAAGADGARAGVGLRPELARRAPERADLRRRQQAALRLVRGAGAPRRAAADRLQPVHAGGRSARAGDAVAERAAAGHAGRGAGDGVRPRGAGLELRPDHPLLLGRRHDLLRRGRAAVRAAGRAAAPPARRRAPRACAGVGRAAAAGAAPARVELRGAGGAADRPVLTGMSQTTCANAHGRMDSRGAGPAGQPRLAAAGAGAPRADRALGRVRAGDPAVPDL